MTDRMGWICPVCFTARPPNADACCTANAANVTVPTASAGVSAEVVSSSGSSRSSSRRSYRDYSPTFEEFWQWFPSTRGKAAASDRFERLVAQGVDANAIIEGAKRYRLDPTRDPAKTKYAQGWLHDGRWQDYDEPTEVSHPAAAVPDIDFEADQRARWAEQGWSEEDEAAFVKNGGVAAMAFLKGDDA